MANAVKTIKSTGKEIKRAGSSLNKEGKRVSDDLDDAWSMSPDIPEEEEATIIPLPDENSAQLRARKKRAQAKTSGRSSTILTEGLGG